MGPPTQSPLASTFPVLMKYASGIPDDHAEQRASQPEHRAVAPPRGDGLRGADDVTGADRRGQRRSNGLRSGSPVTAPAPACFLNIFADRFIA